MTTAKPRSADAATTEKKDRRRMNGNGNGARAARTVVVTVASTLLGAAIIGLLVSEINQAGWRGQVEEKISHNASVESDARMALQVAAQHGEEMKLLAAQMENLRGEVSTTRSEMLEALRIATADRFKMGDWEREEEILNLKFASIEEGWETCSTSLIRIEEKLDQYLKERLEKK